MMKKEDLPNGTRVTLAPKGIEHHRSLAGHSGTVIGRSDYAGCVRVKWDHLKGPITVRADFLKAQ